MDIEQLLKGKNAKERAQIKSREIAKCKIEPYSKNNIAVQIIGTILEIPGGIEFFAKAWKDGKQLGFMDGTVEIERFRIFNPPVLIDDPNGEIVRKWTDEITKEKQQRKLKYDPAQALKNSLAHTIGLVAKDGKDIIKGKVGNTTSTFYPEAGSGGTTVDGRAYRMTAGDWATIRAGAGTGADTANANTNAFFFFSAAGAGNWGGNGRSGYTLNTASIPDTDVISSAIFSLYGTGKEDGASVTPDINIYDFNPTNDNNIVAADYGNFGLTAYSTIISYASWNTSAYNDFSFNPTGKGAINKTGITGLGSRNANYDVSGTPPSWSDPATMQLQCYHADQAGAANDPKLVVVHEAAAVGKSFAQII